MGVQFKLIQKEIVLKPSLICVSSEPRWRMEEKPEGENELWQEKRHPVYIQ